MTRHICNMTRSLVPHSGTTVLVPKSWHQNLGTIAILILSRPCYQVLGTKILIARTWYQDIGAANLAQQEHFLVRHAVARPIMACKVKAWHMFWIQISRFADSQTPAPSNPNLPPLPVHPRIKYVTGTRSSLTI